MTPPVQARLSGAVVLLCAVVVFGCFGHAMTFDHLRDVDRVEVRTNHDKLLKTIQDAAVIAAAQAAVARHDLGWSTPWYGTPVPRLQVNFYKAGQLLGGYGVGIDFLTTDPGPTFMSRAITHSEALQIAATVGVPLPSE